MTLKHKFLASALMAAPFILALNANATYVCTVQKAPEGFVALQAKPSADSEVLTKTTPGDAIVIQQNDNGDWIEDGSWVSVFHYPGEIVPEKSDPEYANGRIGWMPRSFVGDCG